MNKSIDIRKAHDDRAAVDGGVVYISGSIVQAWWEVDCGLMPETWALPDTPHNRQQARENFASMVERWR